MGKARDFKFAVWIDRQAYKPKKETMNGLSIDTMTFDSGWPWTVLVQSHESCTPNISKLMTDTDSIGQTPSSLERYLVLLIMAWPRFKPSNVEVTERIYLHPSLIPLRVVDWACSAMWLTWTTVRDTHGLRLSPSHRNPLSRCLEETTGSPSQGVRSTDWRRLCPPFGAPYIMWQVAATQRDRRYGPPMCMRSEGRKEGIVHNADTALQRLYTCVLPY